MDINGIFASVVVWIVTALLGYIIGKTREYHKAQQRKDTEREKLDHAMQIGMRSLLRNALMETHRRCVIQQGYCEVADKEITERNYLAYHDLGGNGTGTRLYSAIMELPVKDD